MPPEKPESQYKTVLYLSESSPTLALAKPLCNGFVNWHIHFENLETSFKTRGNFPLGGSSHLGSFAGRRLDKYCDQTACERKVLKNTLTVCGSKSKCLSLTNRY